MVVFNYSTIICTVIAIPHQYNTHVHTGIAMMVLIPTLQPSTPLACNDAAKHLRAQNNDLPQVIVNLFLTPFYTLSVE